MVKEMSIIELEQLADFYILDVIDVIDDKVEFVKPASPIHGLHPEDVSDEEDEEQQKKEKEHRGPKDRLTANYRDRVKRFFSNRRVKGSRRGNQNDSLAQMRKEDVNALCGGINMVRLDPTYYAEFYNEYREAYSFVRYLLYVTIDSGVGSCSPCLSQFPLICRCSPHLFALLFEQFGHLN